MNQNMLLALAMLVGGAIGAIAINGLHAHVKARGAYAAVEINKIPGGSDATKMTPQQEKNTPKTGDFDGLTATSTRTVLIEAATSASSTSSTAS